MRITVILGNYLRAANSSISWLLGKKDARKGEGSGKKEEGSGRREKGKTRTN